MDVTAGPRHPSDSGVWETELYGNTCGHCLTDSKIGQHVRACDRKFEKEG